MSEQVKAPWADKVPNYRQALGLTVLDPEVQAFQAEVAQTMREMEAYRIAENQARRSFRDAYTQAARAKTGRIGRLFNQHVKKAERALDNDLESGTLMLRYVDEVLAKQLNTTEKQMKSTVETTALDGKKDNETLLQLRNIVLNRLSEKPGTQSEALKRMSLPPTRHW